MDSPALAARAHVLALAAGRDPGSAHFAAARAALGEVATDVQVDVLAREVLIRLQDLVPRLRFGDAPTDATEPVPMLFHTQRAAQALRDLGPHGALVAVEIEETARERWREAQEGGARDGPWFVWLPVDLGVCPFAVALAEVLWADVVKPGWIRGQPALALALVDRFHAGAWAPGRDLRPRDDAKVDFEIVRDNVIVARFDGGPKVPEAVASAFAALPSLTSHRLLRWLVAEAYRRRAEGRTSEYHIIRVERALSGLCDHLGIPVGSGVGEVEDALDGLRLLRLDLPGATVRGLLTWDTVQTAAPGRPAVVSITLSSALLPNYVCDLPTSVREERLGRRLVPLPWRLPPMQGLVRRNDRAQLPVLQMLVLREFVVRADEYVTRGAIDLSDDQWVALVEQTGAKRSVAMRILEGWTAEADDGPAFLARKAGGLALASAYSREDAMIRDGVKKRSKRPR